MDKETAGRTIEKVVSSSLLTSSVEGWERPGFSLGMDEWFAEDFPPPKKKRCLSLSRRTSPLQDSTNRLVKPGATSSTNRFTKPVEASVLSEAAKGVIPLKTEQSTRWAVNNFECWARSRASSSVDTVPLNTLLSHDAELVCKWLCCFIFETRKVDGSRYPRATLRSLVDANGAPVVIPKNSLLPASSPNFSGNFSNCTINLSLS